MRRASLTACCMTSIMSSSCHVFRGLPMRLPSTRRTVRRMSRKRRPVPASDASVGATLSPDGRYIAAAPVDGQKLMIYDVAAQKWSDLAKQNVNAIRWSYDSQYVYFDTQSNSDPAIYRVRVSECYRDISTSRFHRSANILPLSDATAWGNQESLFC